MRRFRTAAVLFVTAGLTLATACGGSSGGSDGGGGSATGGDGANSATGDTGATKPSTADSGSAATSEPDAPADQVTVTYLTHWGPETVALLEAAAKDYMSQNPSVNVEINAVPFGDLLTTIRSQAGGSSSPTIAGIYDLWLPELVRDEIVTPAPDPIASEVGAEWSASTSGAATVDGSVYGIPNEVNLYALNYNKRLFEEAGITEPPATWDELVADAEALTVRDGDTITQQGFGLINSWAAGVVHPFASLLLSNGGELVVDGAPALDSKNATETFELYQTMVQSGYTDPQMGTADANTAGPFIDNFVSGKTAMIIMANWWESGLKAGMGDSFSDIATAPIPIGPNGTTATSVSYSWMTVVSASATDAEQAAAWAFLQWLNSPESGENGASAMAGILRSMGIIPSRVSDVEAYSDELDSEFLAGYLSQLDDAQPFPIVLGGQEFTEALQQQIESLEFGQVDAAQAQATAQSDGASILSAAGG